MVSLHVPSLQHLARNWQYDPKWVQKALVHLALNPPFFSYDPLFGAVRDLILLGVPYDQVVDGIRRIRREVVRDNLLSILPLIRDHFADLAPDYVQEVAARFYPAGRGLMIPFKPPLIYGVGGQMYFPWFSFWRSNPLISERRALFVTLVEEVLLQDPDLENARFQILDFSAPKKKLKRELNVVEAADIPRVSDSRKREMLEIFAEGFFLAKQQLDGMEKPPRPGTKPEASPDEDQPGLFDD